MLINNLIKKRFRIYYKDITLDVFKKCGLRVYKALMPQLQPLYLNEQQKEIRYDRLKAVAKYFELKEIIVNKIPHPFL